MDNKECVLNLIEGKSNDRLIWAPRMKIWHKANKNQGTLPKKYQGKSLIEIVEYIYQDITYAPAYDGYITFEKEFGDQGVPIVDLERDPMFLITKS